MTAMTPQWLKFANHYTRNEVLDGDNVFLEQTGPQPYSVTANAGKAVHLTAACMMQRSRVQQLRLMSWM